MENANNLTRSPFKDLSNNTNIKRMSTEEWKERNTVITADEHNYNQDLAKDLVQDMITDAFSASENMRKECSGLLVSQEEIPSLCDNYQECDKANNSIPKVKETDKFSPNACHSEKENVEIITIDDQDEEDKNISTVSFDFITQLEKLKIATPKPVDSAKSYSVFKGNESMEGQQNIFANKRIHVLKESEAVLSDSLSESFNENLCDKTSNFNETAIANTSWLSDYERSLIGDNTVVLDVSNQAVEQKSLILEDTLGSICESRARNEPREELNLQSMQVNDTLQDDSVIEIEVENKSPGEELLTELSNSNVCNTTENSPELIKMGISNVTQVFTENNHIDVIENKCENQAENQPQSISYINNGENVILNVDESDKNQINANDLVESANENKTNENLAEKEIEQCLYKESNSEYVNEKNKNNVQSDNGGKLLCESDSKEIEIASNNCQDNRSEEYSHKKNPLKFSQIENISETNKLRDTDHCNMDSIDNVQDKVRQNYYCDESITLGRSLEISNELFIESELSLPSDGKEIANSPLTISNEDIPDATSEMFSVEELIKMKEKIYPEDKLSVSSSNLRSKESDVSMIVNISLKNSCSSKSSEKICEEEKLVLEESFLDAQQEKKVNHQANYENPPKITGNENCSVSYQKEECSLSLKTKDLNTENDMHFENEKYSNEDIEDIFIVHEKTNTEILVGDVENERMSSESIYQCSTNTNDNQITSIKSLKEIVTETIDKVDDNDKKNHLIKKSNRLSGPPLNFSTDKILEIECLSSEKPKMDNTQLPESDILTLHNTQSSEQTEIFGYNSTENTIAKEIEHYENDIETGDAFKKPSTPDVLIHTSDCSSTSIEISKSPISKSYDSLKTNESYVPENDDQAKCKTLHTNKDDITEPEVKNNVIDCSIDYCVGNKSENIKDNHDVLGKENIIENSKFDEENSKDIRENLSNLCINHSKSSVITDSHHNTSIVSEDLDNSLLEYEAAEKEMMVENLACHIEKNVSPDNSNTTNKSCSEILKQCLDYVEDIKPNERSDVCGNEIIINNEISFKNQSIYSQITSQNNCDNFLNQDKSHELEEESFMDVSTGLSNCDNTIAIVGNETRMLSKCENIEGNTYEIENDEEFVEASDKLFEPPSDDCVTTPKIEVRKSISSIEFDNFAAEALKIVNTPQSLDSQSMDDDDDNESFVDADEFFHSEEDFNLLERHSTAENKYNLARNSLFMKFDPLLENRKSIANFLSSTQTDFRKSSALINFSPEKTENESKSDNFNVTLVKLNDTVNKSVLEETIVLGDQNTTVLSRSLAKAIQMTEASSQTEEEIISKQEAIEAVKNKQFEYEDILLRKSRELSTIAKKHESDMKSVQEKYQSLKNKCDISFNCNTQLKVLLQQIVDKKEELEKEMKEEIEKLKENNQKEVASLKDQLTQSDSSLMGLVNSCERMKQMLEAYKRNENMLKNKYTELQNEHKTKKEEFKSLFTELKQKLIESEQEKENDRKKHDAEYNRMVIMIKSAEMKILTLKENLTFKNQQLERLQSEFDNLSKNF